MTTSGARAKHILAGISPVIHVFSSVKCELSQNGGFKRHKLSGCNRGQRFRAFSQKDRKYLVFLFISKHLHEYSQGNKEISINARIFGSQGFTKFHFTPLEVLAVIEGIQLRLKRTFSAEEIESGILEDLIIESDYDVLRVVSECAFKRYSF